MPVQPVQPRAAPMKSFGSRLLDLALSLLAVALLLSWAWALLRPLLPVIITVAAVLVAVGLVVRWRRFW